MTFFEKLLLAHVIGDYVLQTTWMASRKGAHYLPCIVHCLIYTLVVCLFTSMNPWWILFVFSSHFFIDKWSLADKWLKLIRGRSISMFLGHGHEGITSGTDGPPALANEQNLNYRILRGGFASLVYAIVDNAFHVILMLLGGHYLGLW
jgi:Protein of unknown function (DUF3307)